jgi:flagellar biosynthesis protein FliQ
MAYSVVAFLVAGTERALAVDHPLTHFFITLFSGVVVGILVFLVSIPRVSLPFWPNMVTAFYTAIISLPVLWMLNRLRRSFRFRIGR